MSCYKKADGKEKRESGIYLDISYEKKYNYAMIHSIENYIKQSCLKKTIWFQKQPETGGIL